MSCQRQVEQAKHCREEGGVLGQVTRLFQTLPSAVLQKLSGVSRRSWTVPGSLLLL